MQIKKDYTREQIVTVAKRVFLQLIFFILRLSSFTTFTIAFTLCTDIVAEHGAEDEVLLGRQLVERTGDEQADGIETLAATKVHIDVILACGLQYVVYRLVAQATTCLLLETAVAGEEYHPAYTFLIFVDMIHQHAHL